MKKIILALVVAAGCSKGGDIGKLESLKTEACACKDKACGDEVNKKMDDAMLEMAKAFEGKEPDEATQKKLMTVMTEAGLCLAKLK